MDDEIDFESLLRAHLNSHTRAIEKATTIVHLAINESKKASYVAHINSYLDEDKFMKQFLPIDPSTNALCGLAKDEVLLCKLINIVVLETIDEPAINIKRDLNPWERNENHTLGLNSAKAIGFTVVNIGTQDMEKGRPFKKPKAASKFEDLRKGFAEDDEEDDAYDDDEGRTKGFSKL
ncbi:hypothetical protein RYX36_012990 [Vicia faba]